MNVETSREDEGAGWRALALLIVGYVGVYLCRKNLSVAVPLLQQAFGATKAQVGGIASVGTLAYAVGKVVNGPVVDRLGGRRGLLLSLLLVALFGAAGAFAPGLAGALAALRREPLRRIGVLGIDAQAHAHVVRSGADGHGGGRAQPQLRRGERRGDAPGGEDRGPRRRLARRDGGALGRPRRDPGAVLLHRAGGAAGCGQRGSRAEPRRSPRASPNELGPVLIALFRRRQFLVTCALSFTLTLMRESFNTWSVDFLVSIQHGVPSMMTAGLQSTGFDVAGGVSILAAGVAYDRVRPSLRRWLMAGCLGLLALVVLALPPVAAWSTVGAAVLVGAVGLLVYGPYSLLAGALAIASGGKEAAATAAGLIDGVGYVAGALAGAVLGKLLDVGGYTLGFRVLAGVTLVSALIALGLGAGRARLSRRLGRRPVDPGAKAAHRHRGFA